MSDPSPDRVARARADAQRAENRARARRAEETREILKDPAFFDQIQEDPRFARRVDAAAEQRAEQLLAADPDLRELRDKARAERLDREERQASMFRGQVSTNSGDIYAGDPLYDPAVLEALASGASTEQVQQLATAAAKEKQAQAAQRSQAREIMYEAARFCGRPLGNGETCRPATPCGSCASSTRPVFEGDDDARRYLQSGSSPETKGLPQLDWSEFPDHQPGAQSPWPAGRARTSPRTGESEAIIMGMDGDYDGGTPPELLEDEVARYLLPPDAPGSPRARIVSLTWTEQPPEIITDADGSIYSYARQLADRTGQSLQDILDMSAALETGRSDEERAAAILALSEALEIEPALSTDQVLCLTVSAAERRSLATQGKALGPEGDFPIPDRGHLASAIGRYKAGSLAGHSKASIRSHILKNAKRLGVPVDLDGDHDSDHDADSDHDTRDRTSRKRRAKAGTGWDDGQAAGNGAATAAAWPWPWPGAWPGRRGR